MPAYATFIGRELPICQYTAINTAYTEVELPTAYAYLRTGGNQPSMVARLISAPMSPCYPGVHRLPLLSIGVATGTGRICGETVLLPGGGGGGGITWRGGAGRLY
jgi:hypothetical protein